MIGRGLITAHDGYAFKWARPDGILGGIMSADDSKSGEDKSSLQNRLSRIFGHGQEKLTGRVKEWDARKALDAVLDAPKSLQREWQKNGPTGILTKFPIFMVLACLLASTFFAYHSGFVDGTSLKPGDEPSLNVNGSLDVYLPEGSPVLESIKEVELNWTTNVMIIYIESNDKPIDDRRILQEMSYVESKLNPILSSPEDDVIYALSLSTVIKEVNSSLGRIEIAVIDELAAVVCNDDPECVGNDVGDIAKEILEVADPILGKYSIPSQPTIDTIVNEMYEDNGDPSPGLDKLARDIDDDGFLDRAVIIIGVSEERTAKEVIEKTQNLLDEISKESRPCEFDEAGEADGPRMCDWDELGIKMTLTGPVPITNAVTEFSFKLFWQIFPLAIVLVAIGLFVFHSDILQTGSWRPVQGFKVVIIAGLPTLCSVFWTLGLMGYTGYEVTMTVIIVGPILLALGVSYGLHITNRYAEETGTKDEKIRQSLASTGRAVFLSAVTTVIGFISLTFTPMKPIETVGIALSGGIIIVYFLTMAMVPNLTLLLDLRKAKHPPLPIFEKVVQVPIKWSKAVIAFFMVMIFISGFWGQENVEENIDLLGMAPEDEPAVITMKQYSKDFNAGQVGMVLIQGDISGDSDELEEEEPVEKLLGISALESDLNTIDQTNAVSIVFLMKSVGFGGNLSGTPLWNITDNPLVPEELRDALEPYLNRQYSEDVTFWEVLTAPRANGTENTQAERFLLNVFYSSLTDETRGLFISDDYSRNLIYVDMPFVPVAETSIAVDQVNEFTSRDYKGDIIAGELTGVAATAIAVNELIVSSQWSSLGFAVALTLMTLAIVFKDIRFSICTTAPVIATVSLQWLVMWQMDVSLSLVTVMIGSILVGVGVDFSIHIANRIRELGGGIEAIRTATVSTGMSLFEAATVTTLGMVTAYQIPIPEIKPFITVIIILLWIAAASALILLPAIFVLLEELGIGSTGGASSMARKLGLGNVAARGDVDLVDATLIPDHGDAW